MASTIRIEAFKLFALYLSRTRSARSTIGRMIAMTHFLTSQSQRPSTTTSRRIQTPNSPSMKTTSSTSSTRRTTSESHTSHSHSHTLTPCSWWKAKLKDDAGGADGQVGLVPATYVEEVSPSVHPSFHPSMPLSWATSRRFTRASRTCMRSSSSPGNTVASHPSLEQDCGCTRNHVPRNNVA